MSMPKALSWCRFLVPAIALSMALGGSGLAQAQDDPGPVDSITVAATPAGSVPVLVELTEPAAAVAYGNALKENAALGPQRAQALAVSAGQLQIQRVGVEQDRFDAALAALPVKTEEIYRVRKAFNGVALQVDAGQMAALRRLPGVRAVHPIEPEYPTRSNSVPFLGTPKVWANTIGLPMGADGTGIRIGIIDTGIDYQHADFGGTGLLADYQANVRTVAPDAYFPSAKVVGGTDFAGDAYNGNNAPAPDPDPMDCTGHGSHVAGIAAGFGVNADGTTYAGPYTPSASFGAMRIQPGTAPKALLYAIRVFGCGGSTNLTVQGIDWAMDPNGDNDLSDHLDVINMSLGSPFGSLSQTSALASENAAAAGVIVVTSAGNSGDTYYITGAPGSATHAIATAASADDSLAGPGVKVNAPAGIAGFYVAGTAAFGGAPPPAGLTGNVVVGLDPADAAGPSTSDGCSPLTNAAAVAGNIALIDRGTCGFVVKVKNAQNAGAAAVIIANSAAGAFGNMGGADPTITIPSVMVTFADGNTFKANIPGLNVTLLTAADTLASFSSRGPRRLAPLSLKPDITAPGVSITSAQTGSTCDGTVTTGCINPNATGFIPGSQALVLSGTSMASPHMAGIMALLRQLHPDWTAEELKALAMNYANHDVTFFPGGGAPRYGPGRVGAGRVDPSLSALGSVVAFNADDPGAVSLTFDPQVVGTVTRTHKLRLVNQGATAQTYDLALDNVVDAPGVAFSLPGGASVTVPAAGAVEIDVQMDANSTLMDHTRDSTIATTQAVTTPASLANLAIPRHWMTEEAGYVTLSQGGSLKLRVPVYVSPRPASTMAGPTSITTGGAPTGSTTIPLSGTDVCTGTLGAGPTCTGTFPNDEVALVSPFELQVVSPVNPANAPAYADLQYAGVSTDGSRLWFGLSTWGDWSSPTDVSFNVYIDNNLDGTWDRIIFNTNSGSLAKNVFGVAGQPELDTFITAVFIPPGSVSSTIAAGTPNYVNRLSAASVDSALFNNNVMFLGATPAQLGLASTSAPFRYKIETCPGFAPLCQTLNGFHYDDAVGPYTWNGGAQGLNFGGGTLLQDLNGGSIPVTWNTANMTANGSLGALLLHHHNAAGTRPQVIPLQGTATADLAVTKAMAPVSPSLGQTVTFTVTVTNNGPGAATGVLVNDSLPSGLTYVSDDGGGAYSPGLGVWTVGALANGGSATLHIVATVDTTTAVTNVASIGGSSPLDPNAANDRAQVTVSAPSSADLAVTLTASSPTVLVGGSVTYTLKVTNNGNDTAYGLNVNDVFPAYPALHATSFTASRGSFNSSTGLWNLASLGKGAMATLAITVTAPNIAGPLTNNGTAGAGQADPNSANNTASATVTVLSPATITATKTVAGSFVEGGAVTYTVVLSNSGSFDQQDNPGHEFTDALPAQLTLVSATATSGTAVATVGTSTVTWDGVVPAGGSVTVTINATVKTGTALQTVSNQGTASYDADGNGTNEASASTDDPGVAGAADPTSFKVVSPATVTATKTVAGSFVEGGSVTYTVVLSNSGSFDQQDNPGHEFTDALPAQLTLVSATATSGTAVATVGTGTVTWDGVVPAGGSVTVTINATVNTGTALQTVSNQGTASYDADGNGTNEASASTDDPGVAGAANPTSFKVVSPGSVGTHTKTVSGSFQEGGTVTYTVTLSNPGATAQLDNPGDEFTDVLPATLTLMSATATTGTATIDKPNRIVHWNGSLAAGGSVTITIVAVVNNGAGGQPISNQGTAFFDADGNGTNESSVLTDDPATGAAGDPTTFRVASIGQIPTLSEVGLAILALLLASGALLTLRRRRA